MKRTATTLFALLFCTSIAQGQTVWSYERAIDFPAADTARVFPYLASVADDGTLYVVSSRATDTTAHNALWKAAPGSAMMELVDNYSDPRDANIHIVRGITTIGNDVLVASHGQAQPGGIGYGNIYYYEDGDRERRSVMNDDGFAGYGTFVYPIDATDDGFVFSGVSYQTSMRVYDFREAGADGFGNWIAQEPNANVEVEGHDACAVSAIRDVAVIPGMDYTSAESRFYTSRNQTPESAPDHCHPYAGGIAVWTGATAETWTEYESSRVTDFLGDLAISSFTPTGITADREGRLWLSGPDSTKRWVKAFSVEGDIAVEEFELPSATSASNPVDAGAPFQAPVDVALNRDETHAYVIDLFAKQAFVFRRTTTSSEGGATLPNGFRLEQNYPNPFNPSTTIGFELGTTADVRLVVYDVLGREVQVLVDGRLAPGEHAVRFEAAHLPSGVYLYRLEVDGRRETRSMLLSK